MSRRNRRAQRPIPPDSPIALPDAPRGPGVVLKLEEFADKTASNSYRYRNVGEHPLDLAHHRGKINLSQHTSGTHLRLLCELTFRSGRDSTDLEVVSGGSAGTPFTQTQVDAARALGKIRDKMGVADWAIVRAFCGEGYSMADSVRRAQIPFHANGVPARVAEALDALEPHVHHAVAVIGRRAIAL